jgi:S1-C subfamily serine protease
MANVFASLSQDLAATVEAAAKSVVRVEARPRFPASGVVWSADGVIVTANHVIEVDEDLRVGLPDGQTVSATFVGRDPGTDLAVLRAQGSGLTPATWAASALRVGHLVLAVGRPGDGVMASPGMVLGLGGEWRTPTGALISQMVETDITMYPGFSGGPLLDSGGQFVGVNTSGLLRQMNAVIPAATVRTVVETLLTQGRVRRGYLGVGSQPVRLTAALAQQLGQEIGLLINSVEAGSPADKGGLLTGDTLVSIAGQPIRHVDDLLYGLSGDRVGTQVVVGVVRGGEVKEITVVIGERS